MKKKYFLVLMLSCVVILTSCGNNKKNTSETSKTEPSEDVSYLFTGSWQVSQVTFMPNDDTSDKVILKKNKSNSFTIFVENFGSETDEHANIEELDKSHLRLKSKKFKSYFDFRFIDQDTLEYSFSTLILEGEDEGTGMSPPMKLKRIK